MKRLLVLVAVIVVLLSVVVGCRRDREGTVVRMQGAYPLDVHYYHDDDNSVGIWVYRDSLFVLPDEDYR